MAGNVCEFINCDRTRRNSENLRMFRFPIKDLERMRRWIVNSGNVTLADLSSHELHKKYICEHHFTDSDYINPVTKSRLALTSVPQPYHMASTLEQEIYPSRNESSGNTTTPIKSYARSASGCKRKFIEDEWFTDDSSEGSSSASKNFLEEIINMPSPKRKHIPLKSTIELETIIEKQESQIKSLKKKIENKNKKIALQGSRICKLNKKLKLNINRMKSYMPIDMQIQNYDFLMKWSKTLVKMQLKKKHRKWQKDEKYFALIFYYKSPSAYKYLRRHIVLPSESIIRRWIGQSKCLPGISKKYFKQIELKAKTMSDQEKTCVLSFDEMAIKDFLEYSKHMDFIEGFEDMGHLGRSSQHAKYAMVFMARGLYSSWKLPLAYYFSHSGVPGETIKDILLLILEKCFSSGLNPVAVVCDQATTNQKCYKLLDVTKDKPYFEFQFAEKSNVIVALFDILHLMKNFRNNLLNGNYLSNGKTISFEDIRKVYNLDKNKKCRALLKLTDVHVNPNNFQRMSVKLAAQVLSNSVASAIKTCIETGEINTTSAECTADFIGTFDKVFDCLNSRRFRGAKPTNCALHTKNPIVEKTLQEAVPYFLQLRKIDHKGKVFRPPCFDGIIQTINAVLFLYKNAKQKNDDIYILTTKLNQDVLENLFAAFRQHGGYNPNPTARVFRTLFRSNTLNNLIRPPTSSNNEDNVEQEYMLFTEEDILEKKTYDNIELDTGGHQDDERDNTSGSGSDSISLSMISTSSETSGSNTKESESLEKCAIKYFSGYLAHVTLKQYDCSSCRDNLVSKNIFMTDRNEILIFHKMYCNVVKTTEMEGLKAPSDILYKATNTSLNVFEKVFSKISCKKNLSNKLIKEIKRRRRMTEFLTNCGTCEQHRLFLLKKLVITKLFKTCKLMSSKSKINMTDKKNQDSASRKFKIVKHI